MREFLDSLFKSIQGLFTSTDFISSLALGALLLTIVLLVIGNKPIFKNKVLEIAKRISWIIMFCVGQIIEVLVVAIVFLVVAVVFILMIACIGLAILFLIHIPPC